MAAWLLSLGKNSPIANRRPAAVPIVAGLGVKGDAHQGATVKQRFRVTADPTQPESRQVDLIHVKLIDELAATRFEVGPVDLGENIKNGGLGPARLV